LEDSYISLCYIIIIEKMFFDQHGPSEGKVFELMLSNPFQKYSLSQLKKQTELSYMSVFRATTNLTKKNLLKKLEQTKEKFRVLNFENPMLIKTLEFFELQKQLDVKSKNPKIQEPIYQMTEELENEIGRDLLMVLLILIKDKINLIIAVSSNTSEKSVENIISEYDMAKKFNPTIVNGSDFLSGFKEEENFFKNSWKDMILFYGENWFWKNVLKI